MDTVKSKKVKTWLLVGSVSLNVFLAGMVFSNCLGRFDGGRPPMEREVAHLSEQNQKTFADTMHRTREAQRVLHDQARERTRELAAILAAPTLDVDAYRTKSREIAALRASSSLMMHENLLEVSASLSADERKEVSKTLQKRFRKPPHRHQKQ